jgi:NAD(P)-dependent dehydrogenase (short-subunit alcohol dehydrogenase family)
MVESAPADSGQTAELAGRVAIVTGASKGIGRAYAFALAQAGALVVATARTLGESKEDEAEQTLAGLVASAREAGIPGQIWAQSCDLEREDDIVRIVDHAVANFGTVDIVVNNAGLYPHQDSFAVTVPEWDQIMAVNVRAPYLVIRQAAPHMMQRGRGSIINITSRVARFTDRVQDRAAHQDLFVYAVSKAALDRLTTYFSEELRPFGVAVNGLSPGCVLTDTWKRVAPDDFEAARQSGDGKQPLPEVMGPAVLYLAQQTAETMTGQILHTDTFGTAWP